MVTLSAKWRAIHHQEDELWDITCLVCVQELDIPTPWIWCNCLERILWVVFLKHTFFSIPCSKRSNLYQGWKITSWWFHHTYMVISFKGSPNIWIKQHPLPFDWLDMLTMLLQNPMSLNECPRWVRIQECSQNDLTSGRGMYWSHSFWNSIRGGKIRSFCLVCRERYDFLAWCNEPFTQMKPHVFLYVFTYLNLEEHVPSQDVFLKNLKKGAPKAWRLAKPSVAMENSS